MIGHASVEEVCDEKEGRHNDGQECVCYEGVFGA